MDTMKTLIFTLCFSFLVLSVAAYPSSTQPSVKKDSRLLGSKECTWGPSYWCSNITAAKSCNAVNHCIQTVWEHQTLPTDNDSVCDICRKMVKEARDQLESNETQEEIKEVFEGSCNLIPLKIISKECCVLVDDFIPELIDTLASQMNPQVVCSVAGLCNNARIDKLLAEEAAKKPSTAVTAKNDQCQSCHTVVGKLQSNFQKLTQDQVLQGMLKVCGRMGSFSDGCTNIILTYFDEIYDHLQNNLNPDQVCLMVGVCSAQFHVHSVDAEVIPLSDNGRVNVAVKDDLPCELCEQLVLHLRDLLIANTTESEFQRVLEGLCSQTKSFKSQCLSLVDEYYPQLYHFLVSELNPNTVCVMVGVCHGIEEKDEGPFWAMLPPETAAKAVKIIGNSNQKLIGEDESNSYKQKPETVKIIQHGKEVQVSNPELVQLPIERLMPSSLTLTGNTELCTFCEYFLHFLQEEITSPKTEEKIKHLVNTACEKLPRSVSQQCVQFVNMYGDAFVALLAQEIDPSQLCPLLSLCPAAGVQEVEILMYSKPEDKPSCPLCLFAVTQLEDMVRNKKTEDSIRNALNKLCSHLPKNLASECEDFVHTYTDELIEMLVADLTPQEICVYLKLCDDKVPKRHNSPALTHQSQLNNGDITLTNEIPDNTVGGQIAVPEESDKKLITRSPQCVICEFVMAQIEDQLKNKQTDIKKIVHEVCSVLPKTVSKECNDFVNKYGDMIIQLLIQTMEPDEICSMIGLCLDGAMLVTEDVLDCAICETTVTALDKLLDNPKVDHSMEHVLKKACLALPHKNQAKCKAMIDTYGDSFFHLISKLSNAKAVCQKVGLCSGVVSRNQRSTETLVGSNPCTWGPGYWCKSKENAEKCQAVQHCTENNWSTGETNN